MSGFNYSWPQNRKSNVTNKRKRKVKKKEVEILEEISEHGGTDQINDDIENENLAKLIDGSSGTTEKGKKDMTEDDVKNLLESIHEEIEIEKKQNNGIKGGSRGSRESHNDSLALTEEGGERNDRPVYTELDYYDAACLIQTLYYIKKARELVKVLKVEQIEENEAKLNSYHANYLLDLMVVRIQKNVRRMLVERAYLERMAKRYYKDISFGPNQYYYYAVKLQAWYRGTRMRHKYTKIKPDLLKERYRRSICANCHTKASVKRCLLCRGDFCFNCFQTIHKPTKGKGHHWIYSESFVRKQDAQVKALAAVSNQYIELDTKYKKNPIHYDGITPLYAETPPPTADEFYINDESFEGGFLENSMSTVSMSEWNSSVDNILDSNTLNMSMSFRGSTALTESAGLDKKHKKNKKKVQFGMTDATNPRGSSRQMDNSLYAGGDFNNSLSSLDEFGSFDEFQNVASVVGTYSRKNDNLQQISAIEQAMEALEVDEFIPDELVTNSPWDSMATFPLIVDRLPKPPKKIVIHDSSKDPLAVDPNEPIVEELMPGQFFQTFDTFFKKTTVQEKNSTNKVKSSAEDMFDIKNGNESAIDTPQPKSNVTTLKPLAAASNFYGTGKKKKRNSKSKSSFVASSLEAKSNNKTVLTPLQMTTASETTDGNTGKLNAKGPDKNDSNTQKIVDKTSNQSTAVDTEVIPTKEAPQKQSLLSPKNVSVKATIDQPVQKHQQQRLSTYKKELHVEVRHSAFDTASHSSSSTSSEWTEHWDESSGFPYYYNNVTGESSWVKPIEM